jgi:hypothetical protein
MINLILWEVDPIFTPQIPEEQFKKWTQLQQWVKADLASGKMTTWGASVSGDGFALSELDGKDLYLTLAKYTPLIKFTVKQMLSLDDITDAMQTMQQLQQ